MPFENNIFINCPFDADYAALLRPLVFSVIYFGMEPHLAQTRSSAEIRINQIKMHIRSCRFGIYDLSRSKPLMDGDLPRFNMPYELGLDVGCASFGVKKFRSKRILILEEEPYHYQKVLSDIAGQDIAHHKGNPKMLVRKVRDWFSILDQTKTYPGANLIWMTYNQFYGELREQLLQQLYSEEDVAEMPVGDFIKFAKGWIAKIKS